MDINQFNQLGPKIQKTVADNKIDLSRPQFEVDPAIDRLLAKGTLKERRKAELLSIKQDLSQFALTLNQHFDKDQVAQAPRAPQKFLPARSDKEIRSFRQGMMTASQSERAARFYDWMVYEVTALKQRFVELDYSIEAHLTGLLSENHLYVLIPRRAKTALAEVILKSELRKINSDQVDQFVTATIQAMGADTGFLQATLARMGLTSRSNLIGFCCNSINFCLKACSLVFQRLKNSSMKVKKKSKLQQVSRVRNLSSRS